MKKLLTLLVMTTALSAMAAETTVGTEAQKNLDVVIYNNDRALFKDTRTVSMTTGTNQIAFAGISGQIIPASVLLTGQDIRFIENNFNFDVLSYESLLQKSVGEIVTVTYTDPKSGVTETNQAELLAVNGVHPTLRINGKIDSSYPGRILFNKIPANLRAKPTLVMNVAGKTEGVQELTLNYLSRGLSWDANYVAEIGADDKTMALNGWVSLTNHSGTDYQKARIQLVAGDVNLVNNYARPRLMKSNAMMFEDTLAEASMPTQESIADFHLYTLPNTTDILTNQTKQVSLLSATNVGILKTYTFDGQLRPDTEVKQVKPAVQLVFDNTAENHMGIPLPRGVIRLYKEDSKGKMIFVGEDNINHTGNLETVRLDMGRAFDISADAKQVSRTQIAPGLTTSSYEITLKNGTTNTVQIDIIENFRGTWQILKESVPSTKVTARQAQWKVTVPAGQEATLTYQVQEKVPVRKGVIQ